MTTATKDFAQARQQHIRGTEAPLSELVAMRRELPRLKAWRSGGQGTSAGSRAEGRTGRGMDFEEVRRYQAGDEFRQIDWRVTARTGRLHTKLYREERQRPLWLAVDCGAAMYFGTRRAFKSVAAAHGAALLTWWAAARGDPVGGLLFGAGEAPVETPPAAGDTAVMAWLGLLSKTSFRRPRFEDGPSAELDRVAYRLARRAGRGDTIVLFSDFARSETELQRAIAALAGRRRLSLIHISDPMERELPEAGLLGFTDGRRSVQVDTGDPGMRAAYGQRFGQRRAALEALGRRYGATVVHLGTETDPVEAAGSALAGLREVSWPGARR